MTTVFFFSGRFKYNLTSEKMKTETNFIDHELLKSVIEGGRYKPPNCTSRERVAIIIPFRDREEHLKIFLRHMHPFLQRQKLEYGIFVIELVSIKFLQILQLHIFTILV